METDCPLIKRGYANYYLNNKNIVLCSLDNCPYYPKENRQRLIWDNETAYVCNSGGKIPKTLDKKVKPIFPKLRETA